VKSGIALVDDPTKAPIGYGYIEHISQIIMGLTVDERIKAFHYYIPTRITDLEERIMCVRGAVNQTTARLMNDMKPYITSDGIISIH
jgi:hypothetical protein